MFPPPAHEIVIDALAEQALAELAAMARAAREAIDRRFAFINRSRAQRVRFERYRRAMALIGATANGK